MAFLQLKSTNPQFSYLIKKNPESGAIARSLRKGVLFGYYSEDAITYNAYFRDAFNDISYPEYKDQEFEYVNTTRYSAAQFILNAISDLFRDAFKKRDEAQDPDGVYEHSLICHLVQLDNKRTLKAFIQHFSSICNIQANEVTNRYYKITFTTKKSLYYLLNLVNLFAVFAVIRNDKEYLFVQEDTVEKYLNALTVIDAPYFIRYNFKTDLIRGMNAFKRHQDLLEGSTLYKIEMAFGDTFLMRRDAVESELNFSNNIVDLGCGEGRYIWAFEKKMLKEKQYHAIDTNETILHSLARKIRLKEAHKVRLHKSIDDFFTNVEVEVRGQYDFILGEVIEHMSPDDAKAVTLECLNWEHTDNLIITTPNADFNSFYFEDNELRHPDHHFEFTTEEFKNWLTPICQELPHFKMKYLEIGDKVNGIPVTIGAVFNRKVEV